MTVSFDIKKTEAFDVVVCGGGCAGVIAAVAAAREGASVALLERSGELGGTANAVLVGPFMTCYSPDGKRQLVGGIFDELIRRMEAKGGAIHPAKTGRVSSYAGFLPEEYRHNNVTPFHPGYLSIVMAEMLSESGVKVFLNTAAVEVLKNETEKTVTGIAAYDGREFRLFTGRIVIDCTGDAEVAYRAGAACVQGEDGDKTAIQPMSLFFWIYNADDKKLEAYLDQDPANKFRPFHEMIEEDRQKGQFPIPRNKLGLYHMVNEGEWRLNTTRVQGYDPCDPDSLTEAYFESLRQVDFLLRYFKKCPGLENARLSQIGSQIGVRESRRIVGEYTLTKEDIVEGREFDDTIALCSYMMDLHPSKGTAGGGGDEEPCAPVYAIPYRILVPRDIRNMLVAGRCVSADREALAAIRVIPPVMAMGEAAGMAAAICVHKNAAPKDIDPEELRAHLRKNGAEVDL